MNKVITINLNGVAYQLEEGGYDALRAYLDHAARRLEGNPDKDEIITDIEQAIADKFRALLGAYKTVVNTKEVTGVIAEMGPVEAPSTDGSTAGKGGTGPQPGAPAHEPETETPGVRRLYRIYDGAHVSGLCNGLGAYFGVDPTIFRVIFVVLALAWGSGVLLYLLLSLFIPAAKTAAEKTAAFGAAATAQEFIKRAREGYYEGMKSFHDRHARRQWKRKFRRDMRGWKYGFHQQMHDQSKQWQQQWVQHSPPIFGPVFIAPLLSILLLALVVLMLWAIYSLVTVHAVFGLVMPPTMPLWVGILLVVVAYQLVAWPIKSVRFACYYPAPHHDHGNLLSGLIGSLIGLFFFGFLIWMLDRRAPEFHQWLVELPGLLQHMAETVKGWFAQKA